MNYYAVGDIHGQYFKLNQLIKRLNICKGDELVFVGDYIDRGDMSYEVIDYLIELSKIYKCSFIKGNHEDMFMDYLSGINQNMFIRNGGQKTIGSYEKHGFKIDRYTPHKLMKLPEAHMEFFAELKDYYETDEFIFVHAGIHPTTPMERQPDEYLLWDRAFSYGQTKYEGKPVVFGHTPNKDILNEEYKICIDTGACYDSMGDLTAVKLPERTFIRQGWTLEDMDDGNDNGEAGKEDGKGVLKVGPNFPKAGKGGWAT